MASISPLPGRRPSRKRQGVSARLRKVPGIAVVPGTGAVNISGQRAQAIDTALVERLLSAHPGAGPAVARLLNSTIRQRRSAVALRWRFELLMQRALAMGMPAVGQSYEQGVRLMRALRANGSRTGGKLAAGTCKVLRAALTKLNRAAGKPDPFRLDGDDALNVFNETLKGWKIEDEHTRSGRPGAVGVARRKIVQSVGFLTDTPVTLAHVARMNVRAGRDSDLLLLREQVRVLFVYETHASIKQLACVRIDQLNVGRDPHVMVPHRHDGGGSLTPRKLSREVARLGRVMVESMVRADVQRDTALFRAVRGSRRHKWSGGSATECQTLPLRELFRAAADQARARGEPVGSPSEVDAFVACLTYESVRDGLILDCHAQGVHPVQLGVFLDKRRMYEIDVIYDAEDEKIGWDEGEEEGDDR